MSASEQDKQQEGLRDGEGGTYGTPRGGGEQNEAHTTIPEGLIRQRKGPMNKSTGRRQNADEGE
jgi:hypothetical protein